MSKPWHHQAVSPRVDGAVVPSCYEVVVDEDVADEAARLLADAPAQTSV